MIVNMVVPNEWLRTASVYAIMIIEKSTEVLLNL